MTKLGRVLVVDDETELMNALCEVLGEQGYETVGVTSGADALKALQEQDFDLLLPDLMMPGMDGIEFLKEAQRIDPNAVGIIMTGHGTVQTAVEAMKSGAFDYVLKPFKINMLLPVLVRAMEMRRLREENLQLRESMAIYDLAMAVSFTMDITVILNKIADAVLDQCEADEMSIMLPTGSDDELYAVIVRGEQRENILNEHMSIAEWVISNRETLMLQGWARDPRFAPIKPRPEIKLSISIPLLIGGKCIGVLNVNSKKRNYFPLGKVKALNILASTAASILENARLYAELQKTEQKYCSIFENATEGIFQVAPDGRYLFVNPSMARILGYDRVEELVSLASGMSYERLLDGEAERQGIERQIHRPDGTVIWVSENVRVVRDDRGGNLYYEGTMEDITEHRQLEQEMARLDRLNLVGEMAASIAHEIRNPMTVVRGYLQLLQLKERYASDRRRIEVMIEEIDRANDIITEFLSLAKNTPTELKKRSINDVLTALMPLIKADAAKAGITVNLLLGNTCKLNLDEKQIRQVVLNLVRNGFEAMPNRGVLTIETCQDEDKVVLAIKDQGEGIRADLLEKIGTPFFTTKEKGTGLGLAVCYRIAERHNAKIKVETGKDGTTFAVYFERDLH